MTEAYPLQWPIGRPRTRQQRDGRFHSNSRQLTIAEALKRLQDEVVRISGTYLVISSNLDLRLDGRPRSNQPEPRDSGVAIYFQLKGKPHCLPCDTYILTAHNIAAVAAHIKATRDIERHGVASVEEMFAGFQALPAPHHMDWKHVLGLHRETRVTREQVEAAYRRLARERHPDHGGSHAMMAELNAARDAAQAATL